MKRVIKIVAIMLTLIVSMGAISGVALKVDDPILFNAVEITRKIFNTNLQNETKEEDQVGFGYMQARYLKGLDDQEDFVLVECETGGYAIFEKETLELIEYSDTGSSPYAGELKSSSYYAGPANYFLKKGSTMYNMNTGKIVNDNATMKEIADKLRQSIKAERQNRNDKNNGSNNYVVNSINLENDIELTDSLIVNVNDYVVLSRQYISGYSFFVGNNYIGENDDPNNGKCVTVSAQLLLAYNNWVNDGRLIPEAPNDGERFLPESRTETVRLKPNSDIMKMTTSREDNSDETITFFEKLLSYIDIEGNGEPLGALYTGISEYLTDYAPELLDQVRMDYSLVSIYPNYSAIAKIQEEIDDDRPVSASMQILEGSDYYRTGSHNVVIYGEQSIIINGKPKNGFIAHFGWKKVYNDNGEVIRDFSNVWFNETWVKGYFTFRTLHVHDDTPVDANNHIVRCLECDRTKAVNGHIFDNLIIGTTTIPANPSYHLNECVCGFIEKQYHNYDTYVCIDSEKHVKSCACTYSMIESHDRKFIGYCRYCGVEMPE